MSAGYKPWSTPLGGYRRSCWICQRPEVTAQMHLADVWFDGTLRRVCDACRHQRELTWFCQVCRKEQGGARCHAIPYRVCCAVCDKRHRDRLLALEVEARLQDMQDDEDSARD